MTYPGEDPAPRCKPPSKKNMLYDTKSKEERSTTKEGVVLITSSGGNFGRGLCDVNFGRRWECSAPCLDLSRVVLNYLCMAGPRHTSL